MDQSGQTGNPGPTPPTTWAAPPPPAKVGGKGFDISDFLAFRYLVTPAFMTVIYVIGVIVWTLVALVTMLANFSPGSLIAGLFVFVFGNLYWRIILEFVMVLFRMNDSLQSIDRRGKDM